ncbi:hypothetical protein BDU57DRAFT_513012 [Ampelomyces quisqualis]|uniref:ASTRA-associated protein 1 n=1 Tax=Ampelomyces quisqualis TaxID=50730 RepID=A0A6A5QY20_AMPQU|nr:hypothetical protein BDU57DRAFT_513012 [Ampelomyces quisqualis]
MCSETAAEAVQPPQPLASEDQSARNADKSILIATPAADDKKINVYQFPDERLRYVVPSIVAADTGMVMAVKIMHHHTSRAILILSGYEGGLTAVHRLPPRSTTLTQEAQLVYLSQPHTQPVLSLDASPRGDIYFTSSVDATIAAHCIPELEKCMHHTGLDTPPELQLPAHSKRILSEPELVPDTARQEKPDPAFTAPEVHHDHEQDAPVLQETTTSFAKQDIVSSQAPSPKADGLCSLLSVGPHNATPQPPSLRPEIISIQHPHKVNSTKHAGQQSLRLRSDGRIFATGGWDSRIRIYSSKTLKEVAVLKWHKEGVYAVDFAQVLEPRQLQRADVPKETGLGKLQRQREVQTQLKHWIVAGAKDGKISLWEIF